MKKIFFLIMVAMVAMSCERAVNKVSVRFHVDGLDVQVVDDDYAAAPMRRSSDTPTKAGLTDLWIIEGTNTLCHQVSSAAGFGNISLALTSGNHSLTFIGSDRTGQQVVSGVWSADKWSDTYGCVHALNVQSGMAAQQVELGRVNYVVAWSSTDLVPNTAKWVEIEVVDHRSTLLAGLAGGDANPSYVFTADITSRIGLPMNVSVSGFCEVFGEEETVTTNCRIKDANGDVLYSHTKDVPVLSKRKTIVSGALFGSTKSNVSVNSEWLSDYEVAL